MGAGLLGVVSLLLSASDCGGTNPRPDDPGPGRNPDDPSPSDFDSLLSPDPHLRVSDAWDLRDACGAAVPSRRQGALTASFFSLAPVTVRSVVDPSDTRSLQAGVLYGAGVAPGASLLTNDLWVLDTQFFVDHAYVGCPWIKVSHDAFVAKGIQASTALGVSLVAANELSKLEVVDGQVLLRTFSDTSPGLWTAPLASLVSGGGFQPAGTVGTRGLTRFVVDRKEQGCATAKKRLPSMISVTEEIVAAGPPIQLFSRAFTTWDEIPACSAQPQFYHFDVFTGAGSSSINELWRAWRLDQAPLDPAGTTLMAFADADLFGTPGAIAPSASATFAWDEDCLSDIGCKSTEDIVTAAQGELAYPELSEGGFDEFGDKAGFLVQNDDGQNLDIDSEDQLIVGEVTGASRFAAFALDPVARSWVAAGGLLLCPDVGTGKDCVRSRLHKGQSVFSTDPSLRDQIPDGVYARDVRILSADLTTSSELLHDLYPEKGEISPTSDSHGASFGSQFDLSGGGWLPAPSGAFLFQAEPRFRVPFAHRTSTAGPGAKVPFDRSRCFQDAGGYWGPCTLLEDLPFLYRDALSKGTYDARDYPPDIEQFLMQTGSVSFTWKLIDDAFPLGLECGPGSGVCPFWFYRVSAFGSDPQAIPSLLSLNGARPVTVGTRFALVKNRATSVLGFVDAADDRAVIEGIFALSEDGRSGPVCVGGGTADLGASYQLPCPSDGSDGGITKGELTFDALNEIGLVIGVDPGDVWTIESDDEAQLEVTDVKITSDEVLGRFAMAGVGSSDELRVESSVGTLDLTIGCRPHAVAGMYDLIDTGSCISSDQYVDVTVAFTDPDEAVAHFEEFFTVEVDGDDVTGTVQVDAEEFSLGSTRTTQPVVRIRGFSGVHDGSHIVIHTEVSKDDWLVPGTPPAPDGTGGTPDLSEGDGYVLVRPIDAHAQEGVVFGSFDLPLLPTGQGGARLQRAQHCGPAGCTIADSSYYLAPLALLPSFMPGVTKVVLAGPPYASDVVHEYLEREPLPVTVESTVSFPTSFLAIGADNHVVTPGQKRTIKNRFTDDGAAAQLGSASVTHLGTMLSEEWGVGTDGGQPIVVTTTVGPEATAVMVDSVYEAEQPDVYGPGTTALWPGTSSLTGTAYDNANRLFVGRPSGNVRDLAMLVVRPPASQETKKLAAYADVSSGRMFLYGSGYDVPEALWLRACVLGGDCPASVVATAAHEYAHTKTPFGRSLEHPFGEGLPDAISRAATPGATGETIGSLAESFARLSQDTHQTDRCGLMESATKANYRLAEEEILRQIRVTYAVNGWTLSGDHAYEPWTAWTRVGTIDPAVNFRTATVQDYLGLGQIGSVAQFGASTNWQSCRGMARFRIREKPVLDETALKATIRIDLSRTTAGSVVDVVSFVCPEGVALDGGLPCGLTDASGRLVPDVLHLVASGQDNAFQFSVPAGFLIGTKPLRIGVVYGPFLPPVPRDINGRDVGLVTWVEICSAMQVAAGLCGSDSDSDLWTSKLDCNDGRSDVFPGSVLVDPGLDADCDCVAECSTSTGRAPQVASAGAFVSDLDGNSIDDEGDLCVISHGPGGWCNVR